MKRLLLFTLTWLLLSVVARAQYSGTGTVSLTAPAGASSTQWYAFSSGAPVAISGQTSLTYAAGTPGIYFATYQLAGAPDCSPYNIVITQGSSVSLNGATNNTGGANYQWFLENAAVAGATAANYAATLGGHYRFEFDNGGTCSIKSDDYVVYTLAACTTPSVGGTATYGGGTLCNTSNAGTVMLSGNTGAVVKWQTSVDGGSTFTDLVGTATSYSFTNAVNNQQYRAVVSNGVGCALANSAPVTITASALGCTPATPCSVSISAGPACGVLTPTVTGGTAPFTYQWTGPVMAVTVGMKDATHPYFNTGSSMGYSIDGVQGKELTLVRGVTYSFSVNTPNHPLVFTTSAVGGSTNVAQDITAGVTNGGTTSGTLTFTPSGATPSLIYYNCDVHSNLGWKVNIIDPQPNGVLSSAMSGSYSLTVTGGGGCVSTATATATACPACTTPSVGGTVAFLGTLPICNTSNMGSIKLSGNTGAVVKWQTSIDSGTTFTDVANTATSLSFMNAANNQQYRAVVNNGAGCAPANSTPVTITTSAAACTVACTVLPGTITK